MAIDARYQDNVVLKQDAFQNLLTNIKNYPIIDIDYVAEEDTDELHGQTIWDNYTQGIPCIKITYGDSRTTKGNIIFAEDKKQEISNQKKIINEAQVTLNELNKRKSRWENIYQQNHAMYEDKSNQVTRFVANFDQIEGNKLSFLVAGWNLLYINDMSLNVDDPYQVVPVETNFDPNIVYYTHSNTYLFSRYHYTYRSNNTNVTIDVYDSYNNVSDEIKENIQADWVNKVANGEIYIEKNVADQGPVLINELGPQFFSYENILLTKNPYLLVNVGDNYSSSTVYYTRNPATNTFIPYTYTTLAEWEEQRDAHHLYTYDNPYILVNVEDDYSSSIVYYTRNVETNTFIPYNYTTLTAWEEQRDAHHLYIYDPSPDVDRTFNLSYTSLGSQRSDLLTRLQRWRDTTLNGESIWRPDQKEIFQNFIDFIRSYNKLVFLDTIGIAGYTVDDINRLRELGDTRRIIERITDENNDDTEISAADYDWESMEAHWRADLEGYYYTFRDRIADIVNTINLKINENLKYIRDQIRSISYTTIEYNEIIRSAQAEIDRLWDEINNSSAIVWIPADGSSYNSEYEYATKNQDNKYIPYTYSQSSWNNGVGKYIKHDRTMYGYKYVKVGSNIEFIHTYFTNARTNYRPLKTSELEITNANSISNAGNQASGTFRITINKHVYEVPIKGFGIKSNQPITMSTSADGGITISSDKATSISSGTSTSVTSGTSTSITSGTTFSSRSYGNTTISAKNNSNALQTITLDGNVSDTGTLTVTGATTINNTLKATGTTTLTSTLDVSGNTSVGGTLKATGATTLNNTLTVNSTITSGGNIVPSSNISKDLGGSGARWQTLYVQAINTSGNILPNGNTNGDGSNGTTNTGGLLGNSSHRWTGIYGYEGNFTNLTSTTINSTTVNGTTGNFTNLTINGTSIDNSKIASVVNGNSANTHVFWRGDASWSNTLTGDMTVNGTITINNNASTSGSVSIWEDGEGGNIQIVSPAGWAYQVDAYDNSYIRLYGPQYNNAHQFLTWSYDGILTTNQVRNAVFNDYAEYRTTIDLEPGRVVVDNDDGSLSCASSRLQPGAQIISDTFGHSMGETDTTKTPLAVAGRVLVYTYQDRYKYHAGMAVCSAPNGTVDIMTREEIRDYPDCIVGIVSEIPEYKEWGTNKVKVNNRIWIKVK